MYDFIYVYIKFPYNLPLLNVTQKEIFILKVWASRRATAIFEKLSGFPVLHIYLHTYIQ